MKTLMPYIHIHVLYYRKTCRNMITADAKLDTFNMHYTVWTLLSTCLLEKKIRYDMHILGTEIGKDNQQIDLSSRQ